MKKTRRDFLQMTLKSAAISTIGFPLGVQSLRASENVLIDSAPFQFSQNKLPYEYSALEPHIDAQTMEIHYTKHHAAYVKNVNEALTADNISAANDQEFFKKVSKYSTKVRNNAGGSWNHNFFWSIMKPGTGHSTPSGKIAEAINSSFESFDKFKEQFTQAAMSRFGSGWAWLIENKGKLSIGSTPNQDNPLMDVSELKGKPILALDVWEHAYYLKYQNKRNEYVANWWNLVNWEEAARLLG